MAFNPLAMGRPELAKGSTTQEYSKHYSQQQEKKKL